jgi:hypothetical protein
MMNQQLTRRTSPMAWLAAAAVALSWLGLGGNARAAGDTFVGDVEGAPKHTKIALVVSKDSKTRDQIVAYACSADDGFNKKYARFLTGKLASGKVTGSADEVHIQAALEGKVCKGTIRSGKESKHFTAHLKSAHGPEGLFRAEAKSGEQAHIATWITFKEGNKLMAVGFLSFLKKVVNAGKAVFEKVRGVTQKVVEVATKVIKVAKTVVPILTTVVPGAKILLVGLGVAEKITDFLKPLVNREPLNGKPHAAT